MSRDDPQPSRLYRAATDHCRAVFDGVPYSEIFRRARAAVHQGFRYGAAWQTERDALEIDRLKVLLRNARNEITNLKAERRNHARHN